MLQLKLAEGGHWQGIAESQHAPLSRWNGVSTHPFRSFSGFRSYGRRG